MLRLVLSLLLATAPAARAQEDASAEELAVVEPPRVEVYVRADYPPEALARGIEGRVVLLVELDEAGNVVDVEVLEPAGHGFDDAAADAVRRMRFSPARTAEGPIAVAFPYTYVFELPDEASEEDDEQAILEGPRILEYVEAPYPPEAEAEGIEGTVTLLVTLDDQGVVEDVVVTGPAGHGFDEAALEAVRQMRFSPARTAEGPVGVVFEFTYAFTLRPEVPEETQPAPINLEGRVRRMGGGREVEGVLVSVSGVEGTVTTDADGRFAFRGVPAGRQVIRLRHPEYVETEEVVEVAADELTDVTLWLRALTYRENEAVAYYERERTEVTRRVLSIEEVKRVPGTFGDPVKVVQTLPGAARSPFGTGLLIIRGANPEDSAVYVDGVRIPIVYHLTGTTSVLSPEIVRSVEYLPGGYGVQYGRSTGGTIDVATKEEFGDPKIVAGFDVLDAQVWFEGNVGRKDGPKHGLALGARRSYVDLFVPIFTANQDISLRPYYWDYQLKWIPPMGADEHLSVFVYGFQDILRLAQPPDQARSSDPALQGDLRTTYQAHRLLLRYQRKWGDRLTLDLRPSVGVDLNNFGLGDSFGLDNRNVIFQLRGQLSYTPHPAVEIVPGIDFIGGPWYFDFKAPLSATDLDDPLAERDPVGFDGKGTAWSPAPYLKLNIRPLKDRDRWLITPGIRYDWTTYLIRGGITYGEDVEPTTIASWDPRIATRFVAFEKGDMSGTIKASSGLYSQPPQPFESIGIGVSSKIGAERSWNSSIGFEHRITQAISWDLDIFYRQMWDLVVFNEAFTGRGTEPFTNLGDGRAYGFELILRHAPINRFFGWLSYTFSRSFRRDAPDDDWYPFDFDQPHIFSAQGGYNFPHDIGLSAQVQVVSGNPFTPRNAGVYDADGNFYNGFAIGEPNSQRLPTFVQTSVRVDKKFTFKRWQLDIYLDLINALRGVNAEFTVYNYDYSEYALVRGLPFIPNLGLEATILP